MGGTFLKVDFEEDGSGAGGYAKEMSDAYKQAERQLMLRATAAADIVITTALIPGYAHTSFFPNFSFFVHLI